MALLRIWEKLEIVVYPFLSQVESCFNVIHKALADADPLGVNTNVTFDEVGGLDDRK